MLGCILAVMFVGSLGVFFAGYFLGRNKDGKDEVLTVPILVLSIMIFIWGTASLHSYLSNQNKLEELKRTIDGKKLEQIQKVNAEALLK
jgi:hypothetical protein